MAAAVAPLLYGAARIAAQTGVAYAAGKAINYGLDKGIPKLITKSKKFTSKHKKLKGVSKAIGKFEKGYNSKGGRIAKNVVRGAGSLAAYYLGGKAFDAAGNAIATRAAPVLSNLAQNTHIGRRISGRPARPSGAGANFSGPKKSADWAPPSKAEYKPGGINPKHPGYRFPKTQLEAKANRLSNAVEASGIKESFAPPRKLKNPFEGIYDNPSKNYRGKTKFI